MHSGVSLLSVFSLVSAYPFQRPVGKGTLRMKCAEAGPCNTKQSRGGVVNRDSYGTPAKFTDIDKGKLIERGTHGNSDFSSFQLKCETH